MNKPIKNFEDLMELKEQLHVACSVIEIKNKKIIELQSQLNEANERLKEMEKAIYQMVNRLEADSNSLNQSPSKMSREYEKGLNFAIDLIKGDDYDGYEIINTIYNINSIDNINFLKP